MKFKELVAHADSINIAVEKHGRNKYISWCKEDCSITSEAANLGELASDIESLNETRITQTAVMTNLNLRAYRLPFSESQLVTLLEAARIALSDADVFEDMASEMDIQDDELRALRDALEKYMSRTDDSESKLPSPVE